jgi:hypothetical protein
MSDTLSTVHARSTGRAHEWGLIRSFIHGHMSAMTISIQTQTVAQLITSLVCVTAITIQTSVCISRNDARRHSWVDVENASLVWACSPEHFKNKELAHLDDITLRILQRHGKASHSLINEPHKNCPIVSIQPDSSDGWVQGSSDNQRVRPTVVLPGRTVAVSRTPHLPHFLEEISHVFNAGLENAPESYGGTQSPPPPPHTHTPIVSTVRASVPLCSTAFFYFVLASLVVCAVPPPRLRTLP